MAGAVSVGSRPLRVVVKHDAQIVHEGRVWGLKKVATSEARSAEASVKLALPFMAVVSVIRNFACRSVRVPKSTPRLCSDCTRPPARLSARNSSRTSTPLSAAASTWLNGVPPSTSPRRAVIPRNSQRRTVGALILLFQLDMEYI